MPLNELLSGTVDDKVIEHLKSKRLYDEVDIEQALKSYDINKHAVNDITVRKKKEVVRDIDGKEVKTLEDVGRIAIAMQQLIIIRSTAFLFGNPVNYNAEPETDNEQTVLKAFKRIMNDVKEKSHNRKVAKATGMFKECAELWYATEKDHSTYGFDSTVKIRCALFSPEKDGKLYPYFDKTGDMLAFSREFVKKDEKGKDIVFFETYTAEYHYRWIVKGKEVELLDGYPIKNELGKIPVVYAYQPKFETEDVDKLIERLEFLLSNFADTNDYHASPKIFMRGEFIGFAKKGESGAILQGEKDSKAEYLSWSNAPESVRLEIETLLKLIFMISQTPDLSFEAVKGIGGISGVALKLLFMDAHLKVMDKLEVFDEFLQRRTNIVKAFIGKMNQSLEKDAENIIIEPEVVPYSITSELDELNYWLTANGNKPVISHKQSVISSGLSKDPESDYEQILEEIENERINLMNDFTEG